MQPSVRLTIPSLWWLIATLAMAFVFALSMPHPASAVQPEARPGAIVLHPDEFPCSFDPGDVAGVDVYFPGACMLIMTPSGNQTIVGRATLPEEFTLTETYRGEIPCFGGVGKIVATPSGQVTATCHFRS